MPLDSATESVAFQLAQQLQFLNQPISSIEFAQSLERHFIGRTHSRRPRKFRIEKVNLEIKKSRKLI